MQGIIGRLHEAVDAIEQAYATGTDVIRTRRLEVIDGDGTVRAVIAAESVAIAQPPGS